MQTGEEERKKKEETQFTCGGIKVTLLALLKSIVALPLSLFANISEKKRLSINVDF